MELDSFSYTFSEERDTAAPSGLPDYNTIDITSVNNGVGNYLVIETERWALDDSSLEELYATLKELLQKAK